jgi:serum/glucocorticoid-regulated kinase 2
MYELIEKFPVRFPDPDRHKIIMSEDAKDLITKLLTKEPTERLGTAGGVADIIAHPWFNDIDFAQLMEKTIESPFKPDLSKDAGDTSNFDDQFTDMNPTNSMIPKTDMAQVRKHQADFKDFDG